MHRPRESRCRDTVKNDENSVSTSSKTEIQSSNHVWKIFWPLIFARLCAAITRNLNLRLTREQLNSLYKEILETAYYNNDIHLMIYMKELLPTDIQLNEVLATYLSKEGDYYFDEKRDIYLKVCIEHAKKNDDKLAEMNAYRNIGEVNRLCNQYYDFIVYNKKCLAIAEELGDKLAAMASCLILGSTFRNLNQNDDAIAYSKKCIDIAKEINQKDTEMTACFIVGKLYFKEGNYKDSVLYGERCLQNAKAVGDKRYESMVYLLIQDCQYRMSEYKEAVISGQKCIAAAKDFGDKIGENYAYVVLGHTYESLKKCEKAVHCFMKSEEIAREIGDKHAQGDAYIFLGKAFDSMDQKDNAILQFKKGIAIFQDIDLNHEMNCHFLLGKVYKSSSQYNEAIESFKKSIVIAWRIGDKYVERDVYFQIGNIYECMNQFNKAINYGKKYMEAAKKVGDDTDVTEAYLSLGVAYLALDQYDQAFFNLNEGLKLATESQDVDAIESFNHFLEEFYIRIGLKGQSSIPKSKPFSGSAGLMLVDFGTQSSREDMDNFLDKKPFFKQYLEHRANNEYQQAIGCLRKHLDAYELCPRYHSADKVYCLIEIAKMHLDLHQREKSLQCCQEALAIAESVDAKHLQAECYTHQGQVYFVLGRMKAAEDSLMKAIQCFEFMFDDLGPRDDFKMSLLDRYVHSYKNLVSILIHTKQLKRALIVSDESRARSLKDLLLNFGMTETSERQELQECDVVSLVSNYSILFYSVCCETVSTAYTFIIDRGGKIQFAIKDLKSCVHGLNFDGCINQALNELNVRNVGNCENRSLDTNRDDTDGSIRLKQDEAANLSTNHCQCECGKPTNKKEETNMRTALEELRHRLLHHDTLFSVKRDRPKHHVTYYGKQKEIVIIPDGPLYKVPFAALRDPDTGRYLSETKRIRLAPSLATLKVLQERTEDYYSKKGIVVVGDPLVGKVMFNGEETEFPPLEDAFCEALAVGSLFYETPLTREEATKPAVIERLKLGVAVVHIAAHGSLIKGTIALAPSPEIRATKIPDEEDYMLTMADVQQAQVRAQLVVLSCCHSGRGEIRAEGVVGMCRAFLASGARAVVASLWAIDDEATLEFMTKFYLNLRDGKSAGASLQQAMNEMRSSKDYNEPKYWAPFFLMGDDVTIKF